MAKLTHYAHQRTGRRSHERAQDLAQSAITDVYEGTRAWDPEKDPDLFLFLTSVVNSLASNEHARKRATAERPPRSQATLERAPDRGADPEREIIARDLQDKVWARAKELCDDAPEVARLAALVESEVDEPTEQAAALDVSIEGVRKLRRRLWERVERAARELGMEEPS